MSMNDVNGRRIVIHSDDVMIDSIGKSLSDAINERLIPSDCFTVEQLEAIRNTHSFITNVEVDVINDESGKVKAYASFSNGNLVITLVNIKGLKGDKGDALSFDNLTEEQKELLKGPKGDKGDDGKSLVFDNLTEEQKEELRPDLIDIADNINTENKNKAASCGAVIEYVLSKTDTLSTAINSILSQVSGKQNILSAGKNINIEDNVISAEVEVDANVVSQAVEKFFADNPPAATSAEKVSYNDTTVKEALDNIKKESVGSTESLTEHNFNGDISFSYGFSSSHTTDFYTNNNMQSYSVKGVTSGTKFKVYSEQNDRYSDNFLTSNAWVYYAFMSEITLSDGKPSTYKFIEGSSAMKMVFDEYGLCYIDVPVDCILVITYKNHQSKVNLITSMWNCVHKTINDINNEIESLVHPERDIITVHGKAYLDNIIGMSSFPIRVDNVNYGKPVNLLMCTDIHGEPDVFARAIRLQDEYPVIDDIIHLGDLARLDINSNFSGYDRYGKIKKIPTEHIKRVLQLVGNHDINDGGYYSDIQYSDTHPKSQSGYTKSWMMPDTKSYNAVFPTNDDGSEKDVCYFFKDYKVNIPNGSVVVRCVFYDVMHEDRNDYNDPATWSDEVKWLNGVLEESAEKGYHVAIMRHSMLPDFKKIQGNWSRSASFANFDAGTEELTHVFGNTQGSEHGEVFPVHRLLDNKMLIGLKVIGIFCGHSHYDMVSVYEGNNGKIYQICMGNASAFRGGYDVGHRYGTKAEDYFNLVRIDPYRNVLTLHRIGSEYDVFGQHKGCLSIRYSSGEKTGIIVNN